MAILYIEQLLHYWRHSLCAIELHERSNWRADMHQLFSYTTLYVHTASPYVHHYLLSNYA